MRFNRFAIFAASVAAVLASVTVPLSAQNYKAKMTLPFETRWGSAVLPAGDYVLSTDPVATTPWLHVRGEGVNVTVIAGPVNYMEPSDKGGILEITDVNGTHVVTKFRAGLAGKEFSFAIPKDVKSPGYGVVALQKASLPVTSGR